MWAEEHPHATGTAMHPFLLHAYCEKPVTAKNKTLNALIESLAEIADDHFVDDLEAEFMDNFAETGDPAQNQYEYEFGTFESPADAKSFIIGELDADWWLWYYGKIVDELVECRFYEEKVLVLYQALEATGGADLLAQVIPTFPSWVNFPVPVSEIFVQRWEQGKLLEHLRKTGQMKNFYLFMQEVFERTGVGGPGRN